MPTPTLPIGLLVDVVCAAHLTAYVKSEREERGGILLIAPPGQLKTSLLAVCERYHAFRLLSDMTVKGFELMRESITSGHIRTLGFSEFRKLYQRQSETSSNVEGIVQALLSEGFGQPNWKDQSFRVTRARCLVMACMTQSFFNAHASEWGDGMLRRVIPLCYRMQDPERVNDAIERSVTIPLADSRLPEEPPEREIRVTLTEAERSKLRLILRRHFQHGSESIPLTLVYKIAIVLKWHYDRNRIDKSAIDVIQQIAQMMNPEPLVELYVDVPRRRGDVSEMKLERTDDEPTEKSNGGAARRA